MIERCQEEIMKGWPQNWAVPVVSVRCITYNHERYIAKALDSFLIQKTDFPFEVVVHDDASTDRTADIIRGYVAKYPKIIKPIYEKENQYSKHDDSLRKIVDSACKGEYIAYCEGDDFWIDENKLQKQYDAMVEQPECSLCTNIVQCVSEKGLALKQQYPPRGLFNDNVVEQDDFAEALIAKSLYPFQTCSYFLRKSLLQENEIFFDFPACGDDKILRLCLNAGKVYFIHDVMSCYRTLSKGSWTCRNNQNKKMQLESLSDRLILDQKFDEFSCYKFHNFVELGKKSLQIKILVSNNQFKDLFRPEFINVVKQNYSRKTVFKFYVLSKLPLSFANVLLMILRLRARFLLFLRECGFGALNM